MNTPTRFAIWCAATHGHLPTAHPHGRYVTYQEYERDIAAKSAECDALRIGMDAAARNADRARAECQRLRERLVAIGTMPTVGPLAAADMANVANKALQETQP